MKPAKALGSSLLLTLLIAGCSSSSASKDDGTPPPVIEQTLTPAEDDGLLGDYGPWDQNFCMTEFSDVVAVHIDYAAWHCEGWDGKRFCEYESLSGVYGPGWGTCQCYNSHCFWNFDRGRSCRYRRCY